MGSLFNTHATLVYQIINVVGIIAGMGCVAMIVFALMKIMIGDEGDRDTYLRRIKNGIVALILILCVTEITKLLTSYFTPGETTGTNIGDFSSHAITISQSGIAQNTQDKNGRNMILVDDEIYVEVAQHALLDFDKGKGFNCVRVSMYVAFDKCQGATSGLLAEAEYYICWEREGAGGSWGDGYWNDNWYGKIFSRDAYQEVDIGGTGDGPYDLMCNFFNSCPGYGNGGYEWYKPEENPLLQE